MNDSSPSLKSFSVPVVLTVVAIVGAVIIGGPEVGLIVALLAVLEISISFDNAIVNAHVLKGMTPKWQRVFLTWGILIAVFGMRLVFPILIVAAAASLGLGEVIDQALNEPETYARNLEDANAVIASYGGIFLLMVFLSFFMDPDKDEHWVGPVERVMAKVGSVTTATTTIAAVVLLVASQLVSADSEKDVLVSGLAGLITYLLVKGIADRLEPDDMEEDEEESSSELATQSVEQRKAAAAAAAAMAKGGFASFMYLEVLDASFSFDGVIGAFAISKDIIVIAVGLGLGALYIRTLTVYLVRQGTLAQYRYLEHGAHWAIGVLAALLFIGIEHHVPEAITGSLGALLIITAFYTSVRANKKDAAEGHAAEAVHA